MNGGKGHRRDLFPIIYVLRGASCKNIFGGKPSKITTCQLEKVFDISADKID